MDKFATTADEDVLLIPTRRVDPLDAITIGGKPLRWFWERGLDYQMGRMLDDERRAQIRRTQEAMQ